MDKRWEDQWQSWSWSSSSDWYGGYHDAPWGSGRGSSGRDAEAAKWPRLRTDMSMEEAEEWANQLTMRASALGEQKPTAAAAAPPAPPPPGRSGEPQKVDLPSPPAM